MLLLNARNIWLIECTPAAINTVDDAIYTGWFGSFTTNYIVFIYCTARVYAFGYGIWRFFFSLSLYLTQLSGPWFWSSVAYAALRTDRWYWYRALLKHLIDDLYRIAAVWFSVWSVSTARDKKNKKKNQLTLNETCVLGALENNINSPHLISANVWVYYFWFVRPVQSYNNIYY